MNTRELPPAVPTRAGQWRRGARTGVAVLLATALALSLTVLGGGAATADTAPLDPGNPATPVTVSSDVLPTVQIDGVAWKQLVVGNTVYVVGAFSTARPAGSAPGVNTVTRNNILAYNLSTGVLLDSFAPSLNAQATSIAASPDGTRIYVGGSFTAVNGATVWRVAVLDAVTGKLLTNFLPKMAATVNAIVVTDTTVYLGGLFKAVGSVTRNELAAFRATDGTLLDWAPSAVGGKVNALVLSPDKTKLVVGGQFTTLNGSGNPGYGLGAVDAVTGALLPFGANTRLVRNGGANAGITSLASDGDQVYGTGMTFGSGGNLEGAFSANWSDGAVKWVEDCHGDTYDVFPAAEAVYTVGHAHYCNNIGGFTQTSPWSFHRALAFSKAVTGTITADTQGYFNYAGTPRPSALTWYPDLDAGTATGQNQGAWAVGGNADYVVMSGEFRNVNNSAQQGLVRFARTALAPNKDGPRLNGLRINPTLTALPSGAVRVAWQANHDRDNENLTYQVIRDGITAAPVYTTQQASTFWNRPAMGFVDTGLSANTSYRYRIFVKDPFGNEVRSDTVTITTAAAPANLSAYAQKVISDQAGGYWRLGEATGTVGTDWAGFTDLIVGSGVTRGTAGAIAGDADTATTFNGGSAGSAATTTLASAPNTFTAEAWVKTTSTSGGKVLGFGNRQTGLSTSYDRHVYMDNAGHLIFGVFNGSTQTISSPASYNDGQWHQVTASLGAAGMRLFVDGVAVAALPTITSGEATSGYWRVGGDNLQAWPSKPRSNYFAGAIDEVAVYPSELAAATVANHYALGATGTPLNQAPTAAFTATVSNLGASFDAAGSTDSDGSIAAYSWDYGDGTPAGTGSPASHTYAAAGTYQVTLTVTDNVGATAAVSHPVTTTAPPANQLPVAAFTATSSGLTATVNGAGSTDPDGSIAAYSWDFGDGTPAGTGSPASHAYAAAGTYQVTLTVTDNAGGTGVLTAPVTVTAPPAGVLASDAFDRTVTAGWGAADVGGGWTLNGTAAQFSVGASGGAVLVSKAGSGPGAYLRGVSTTSTDTTVQFSLDKIANGGGAYASVAGRAISGAGDYRAKVKVAPDGRLTLYTTKVVAGAETTLKSVAIAGITLAPAEVVTVRLQVTGTNPTTVAAKLWRAGSAEPAAWTLTGTDATAELQASGGIGLLSYVSASSTNVPIMVRFDGLSVRTPTP